MTPAVVKPHSRKLQNRIRNAGFRTMAETSVIRDGAAVSEDGPMVVGLLFGARVIHRSGISARQPIPMAKKLQRQLKVVRTTAISGTIRNCPPVAPEVAIPVASPRFRSNNRAIAVETTCVATMPKPKAETPLKAIRKTMALLVADTIRHPEPTRARPRANVTRTP